MELGLPYREQVLERIARVYPRALFYPLNITKASAARTDKAAVARVPGGETHDDVLAKLKALTFDPTLEAFAEVGTGSCGALPVSAEVWWCWR